MHAGGSRATPTVHQRRKDGNPWVAQNFTRDYKPPTRLKHLQGTGADSLKPQIYEAATELGDKIRYGDRPETETFRTQPRATETSIPLEIPQEIHQEIPQENSEKHTDDMVSRARLNTHPETSCGCPSAHNPGEQTCPTHPKPTK